MCECVIHDHVHVAVPVVVVVLLLEPLLLMLCIVFGLVSTRSHQTRYALWSLWMLRWLYLLLRRVRERILDVFFLFAWSHDHACHPANSPVCLVSLDHVSSRPLDRVVHHPLQFREWIVSWYDVLLLMLLLFFPFLQSTPCPSSE